VGERCGALELGASFAEAAELFEEVAAHARQQVVRLSAGSDVKRIDEFEAGGGSVRHADRDRAIEVHDRRRESTASAS
jgi:hypothetical protein